MYLFGIDVPILELLVIFSTVVVVYLIILEIEFRQMRKITQKMDEEELQLSKEVRELRNTIVELKEAVQAFRK
ncbi:MAG: hypothetical protein DRP11_00180 [Candidatus Aenigmatarchaeota archaeon]|nr:MAG: hypothetical protein DRP11_00180 [Candidatus Aenigmarchaeota archaeon]